MEIYTSYYAMAGKIAKEGIKTFGISIKKPQYYMGEMIYDFAPRGAMLRMRKDRYEKLYLGEILTPQRVKGVMDMLKGRGLKSVCFLCYESLHREGEWCHRTMLSDYMKKLGYEVKEWKPKDEPPKLKSTQISLF